MESSKRKNDEAVVPTSPKANKVGMAGKGKALYQLAESTGCLDCFKSIPAGALITFEKGVSGVLIPRCPFGSKLSHGDLDIDTKALKPCHSSPCQGCLSRTTTLEYVDRLNHLQARP